MSEDEVAVLFVSAIFAMIYWGHWYIRAQTIGALVKARQWRFVLYATHLGCFALHLGILTQYAAPEVRSAPSYILLFTAVWAVGLIGMNVWAAVLGVRAFEDGIERNNASAIGAIAGAWLAATLCSCGANIGEGPSIYTTLGPLALALGTLCGLWLAFSLVTRNAFTIAVDRDLPSGIRLAGLLIAWGLILGRAVAGDWVSLQATLRDFAAQGWPALALLGVAIAIELSLRPSPRNLAPWVWSAGLPPGFLYLVVASLWLAYLGPIA